MSYGAPLSYPVYDGRVDNPLFEASYKRLFGEGVGIEDSADEFFSRFYEKFLRQAEIATFFANIDMARQTTMLRRSLFQLTSLYVTDIVTPELRRIAEVHDKLDFPTDYYDVWLDCLIETVRETDPECDSATETAWRLALMPGITLMKLYPQLSA